MANKWSLFEVTCKAIRVMDSVNHLPREKITIELESFADGYTLEDLERSMLQLASQFWNSFECKTWKEQDAKHD